ncbi:hypothetical protein EHW64_10670 [Erwinia psidii]|uniref:hypothetical protein n=1 Tax=Erwinia psidii TaxID=69224 RepID=UPI00226B7E4C|nr:hypothetical protein [Erwinia psidii]MCX8961599.1 hypothetical protein [Erwinia psidii]
MSSQQSDLSNSHYGYDFVVSTTQKSINATMKEYLYNSVFPTVKMYWNQDDQGNPVAVSRDVLLQQTQGTDPLTVPSWNTGDPMTPDIENINNSNFYFAFEAAIGIPSQISPQNIPDIVALQADSQSIIFNLMCANFTVVTCNFGRHGLTSFFTASQPDNSPWLFTSIVALKPIFDNSNLPPDVQAQLNNLGPDAFSVQQLFFDLDNAALESVPTINGLQPGTPAYTLLSQVFLGAYFSAMKTNAQPILNYAIVQNKPDNDQSTLKLTKMNMEVSPYTPVTTPINDLNTLNYLCEVNGGNLPPPVPFTWNWVEAADVANFDGVISINRNTFANYFENQLTSYVKTNCYQPWVRVWLSGFLDTTVNFQWQMTSGQTPTVTVTDNGANVLTYSWSASAEDDAGAGGDMGKMTLGTTYTATVTFSGNTIVVQQNYVVSVYIRVMQSSESWNAINSTITDTYTLAIDQNGHLTASLNTVSQDNADPTPSTNWFIELFTGLNDLVNDFASWSAGFKNTSFHSIPLNVAQRFVFPGGKTFAFKNVNFSDNQDLVSQITYTQPDQNNQPANS